MGKSEDVLLSVVIPTRNHAQLVSELLDTLAAQEPVPFPWEVMVIDNGSTDHTARVTNEKISSLPIDIRYICEPRPGLHNGRHRGALEARGRYLAYLDDDVLLTRAWIHGVEKIMSGQAEAVVGRILPKWEGRPPGWLVTLTRQPGRLSLLDMGSEGFYIDPKFVYGDNFFIRTQTVFDLKGFHPDSMPAEQLRYRGDGESALMMKFKKAGLRAWYDPVATVYHRVPRERMRFEYICKREYAQGISDSFTEIRARHYGQADPVEEGVDPLVLPRKTFQYYMGRLRERTFRQLLSGLVNRILRFVPLSQPNISVRLRKAYLAGYNYHQTEVQKDPNLLRWVLHDDYWDCQP